MRFRLFALLVAGSLGLLFAQGASAGTCSGTCDISLSGGGFTSRSTRYPGYSDSDCRARCVNSCYDFGFPQGSMFTCRDVSYQESAGDAQVRRAATRPGQPVGGTGSTGAAQQQIPSLPTTSAQAGDTCVVTCSNPTAENVQQYLAPASLRVTTQEACLSYCTTHCPTTGAETDRISCLAAHYQPPDAAQAGSTSGATGVSTSTLSTLAASSGSSGSCSGYGGVHDPFCGKSFSTIAGEIIKVLIGIAGVLFLGMLFYGGAQWMMAGDSEDGVKDGRTTIRNAIVGIALVMLSYTLVQLVVTLSGSVGATQGSGSSTSASSAGASGGSNSSAASGPLTSTSPSGCGDRSIGQLRSTAETFVSSDMIRAVSNEQIVQACAAISQMPEGTCNSAQSVKAYIQGLNVISEAQLNSISDSNLINGCSVVRGLVQGGTVRLQTEL